MSQNQEIDALLEELKPLATAGYYVGLHIRFASPLLTFQTYPKAWTDQYTSKAYVFRDPMIAWGISRTGSTRWSDITLPDPFNVMKEAARHGLSYGLCVSVGKITSRTITGLSRSDREFTAPEIAAASQIIHRLHHITQPPETLTKAEIQALQVLASGERYANGAAVLGISESALKARLSSARKKLFARTSAEAIQRAKDYRLI